VHDIFKILADNSINIITAESTSRERQSLHSIEIIVSAREYGSPYFDGTHEERSNGNLDDLADLKREILAHLVDDIAFLPSGQPRLRIRRVRHLLNARRSYNQALTRIQPGHALRPVIKDTTVNKAGSGEVSITLPEQVKKNLFEALGIAYPSGKAAGYFLMVSNTTDRFLRIYFMKKEDTIIAPTIEHQDEIGALAAITEALHNADFNILTSLSRLYQWGSLARTEFVLQPPEDLRGSSDIEAIKKRLESSLKIPTLVNNYSVRVGYPVNYVTPVITKKLSLSTSSVKATKQSNDDVKNKSRSTESILSSRYRELARRISQPGAVADDIMRYQLVQSLVVEQTTVATAKQTGFKGTLFISYSFREGDLFNIISKAAKKNHFNIITGAELGGAPKNRDGIIELIGRCTHFLGVWTHEGGHKFEDKYFPTPWLHWELGVADALGKRWHLLISNEIHEDAWKRIAAETPHSIFNKVNVEQKIKNALRTLSSSASR
jgi:predicted amino acid-binding ACT domain protein